MGTQSIGNPINGTERLIPLLTPLVVNVTTGNPVRKEKHAPLFDRIASAIIDLDADVVCFQEVGEARIELLTTPYGQSPSNAARRINNRIANGEKYQWAGLLNIFSVHTGLWDDEEEPAKTQLDSLRVWAEAEHTNDVAATFLCGDFNAAAGGPSYSCWETTGEYIDQYLLANP
jgi:endonuclease/exonuclease/phosphatase family metal-dependent hydrolase